LASVYAGFLHSPKFANSHPMQWKATRVMGWRCRERLSKSISSSFERNASPSARRNLNEVSIEFMKLRFENNDRPQ